MEVYGSYRASVALIRETISENKVWTSSLSSRTSPD